MSEILDIVVVVLNTKKDPESCWVIDTMQLKAYVANEVHVEHIAATAARGANYAEQPTAVYVAVTKTISTERRVRTTAQATIKVEDGSSIYNALVEALSRAI